VHREVVGAPLIIQIRLVPDQHDDHVLPSLVPHVVDPFRSVQERVTIWISWRLGGTPTCHIVNNHSHGRIPNVGGDQRSEAFLSSADVETGRDILLVYTMREISSVSLTQLSVSGGQWRRDI
jgi:hypothetical protein